MKNIAIICVMLGVGLAAAFGSRNVDAVRDRFNTEGQAQLLEAALGQLAEEKADPATSSERLAAIDNEAKALELRYAQAEAAVLATPKEAVPATDRLSDWFGANGVPFSAGVLLIVLGGLLARRADKKALSESEAGKSTKKKEAIDFGVKLGTTADAVRTLHAAMASVDLRSVGALDPLKERVEAIVRDDIEPLVETRQQVVNRYGMAGFAQLFGPLSGAERYMNRAWVAMVDRHWDEAQESLNQAAQRLDQTLAELKTLQAAKA